MSSWNLRSFLKSSTHPSSKPPFRVGLVTHSKALPDYKKIYGEIKGKPVRRINSSSQRITRSKRPLRMRSPQQPLSADVELSPQLLLQKVRSPEPSTSRFKSPKPSKSQFKSPKPTALIKIDLVRSLSPQVTSTQDIEEEIGQIEKPPESLDVQDDKKIFTVKTEAVQSFCTPMSTNKGRRRQHSMVTRSISKNVDNAKRGDKQAQLELECLESIDVTQELIVTPFEPQRRSRRPKFTLGTDIDEKRCATDTESVNMIESASNQITNVPLVSIEAAKDINTTTKFNTSPSLLVSNKLIRLSKTPQHQIKDTNSPNSEKNEENNVLITPIENKENVNPLIGYVSPFVTLNRGKDKARHEYLMKLSPAVLQKNNPATENSAKINSSIASAVQYFRMIVNNEKERILNMCSSWTQYKDTKEANEEVQCLIDVAIGQSNLLVNNKFVQFEQLIDTSERNSGPKPITPLDLHGFWDLIGLEIENIDKRFDRLNTMKMNQWDELKPKFQKTDAIGVWNNTNVVPKQKQKRPVKCQQATSRLRSVIRLARKKNKQCSDEEAIADQQKTIICNIEQVPGRKVSMLSRETPSKRMSSPGLSMLRASSMGKCALTPQRGILKPTPNIVTPKRVAFKSPQT